MPAGLRRHIANYFRFTTTYFVIAYFVGIGRKLGIWEHYALIEAGLVIIYFLISAWFVWRGYLGMVRDLDFYDEDF
jgi:hypothetical protein